MKFWTFCISSLSALALTGCSMETVFVPYPSVMSANLTHAQTGQYTPVFKDLNSRQDSADYELYAAELGRFQQLAGEYPPSSATFMPLMTRVQADQLDAKIRVSHLLVDTASLLSNDNLIPYQLSGFEIVELYQSQALNFIATGDISNALVALRKANIMQTTLAESYQKELDEVNKKLSENKLKTDFLQDPNNALGATLQAQAGVKSAYLNAMTYYLFAILNLNTGNLNDATAALKQAVDITPENTFLQTALLQTLVAQGADQSTIDTYLKAFHLTKVPISNPNTGTLVVWYDDGLMPPKTSVKIPLPLPGFDSLQIISFPIYKENASATPLHVSAGNTPLASTQMITNVYGLAAKQLSDEYPFIFLRDALRILAKAAASHHMLSTQNLVSDNPLGNLALRLYNIVSANADLRSWLSLPDNTQIGQYTLMPGTYTLHLNADNTNTADVSVPIQAGHISLVWVTRVGTRLTGVSL